MDVWSCPLFEVTFIRGTAVGWGNNRATVPFGMGIPTVAISIVSFVLSVLY